MKARLPAMNANQRKAMEDEIKRQMAEYDEKNTLEIDAMVLWVLYSQFGFGKKKLRKFIDIFNKELDALSERFVMDKKDDIIWLCIRRLKDEAGIDISEWSKED